MRAKRIEKNLMRTSTKDLLITLSWLNAAQLVVSVKSIGKPLQMSATLAMHGL